MKSIGIWIAKGGTGKTSVSGNLAFALKDWGKVLLIDGDPQGNLSSWIHPKPFDLELADIVKDLGKLSKGIRFVRENLDLIPTFGIGGTLKQWSETVLPLKPFTFLDLKEAIADLGYDYLIFDMSPGASMLERAIIASLDEVIPTARPEYFSVDGLEVFTATMEEINASMRGKAKYTHLIINGLNMSFTTHKGYSDAMGKLPFHVHTIPQTIKIPDSQIARLFLKEHDTDNRACTGYAEIAEAVV